MSHIVVESKTPTWERGSLKMTKIKDEARKEILLFKVRNIDDDDDDGDDDGDGDDGGDGDGDDDDDDDDDEMMVMMMMMR